MGKKTLQDVRQLGDLYIAINVEARDLQSLIGCVAKEYVDDPLPHNKPSLVWGVSVARLATY